MFQIISQSLPEKGNDIKFDGCSGAKLRFKVFYTFVCKTLSVRRGKFISKCMKKLKKATLSIKAKSVKFEQLSQVLYISRRFQSTGRCVRCQLVCCILLTSHVINTFAGDGTLKPTRRYEPRSLLSTHVQRASYYNSSITKSHKITWIE